jgi:cytochrome c553
MRRTTWLMTLVFASAFSAAIYSQAPGPVGREPSWAFPVNTGTIPAEAPGPKSLPGSTKQYTTEQIEDLSNPPDWYPNEHPAAPAIVTKGHGGALACGSCHLMSGSGHPESADLSGLSAEYIVQQMADFKSGARKDAARMNAIAKETTDEEVKQAAEYFSKLKPQAWNKVTEAAMAPATVVAGGRMRFPSPEGGMEPIGKRIITVPENVERVRRRDPKVGAGFISYVPPGTLARGKELVDTGAGKTISCTVCHGEGLHGAGNIPRLSGVHPIYLARQLYLFKDKSRNGADAGLMQQPVEQLNDDDILAIAAYIGSLPPQ